MSVHTAPLVNKTGSAALLPSLVIAGFALLHLVLALRFPLAPDETYYWEWSRRVDWGYYDQGPMIAWCIRAGCALFGETELGIRAPIILAFALMQVFTYLLARDAAGSRAALWSLVFGGITPMALAGGFIATYDPIVVAFWAAALFFAYRAVHSESRAAWAGLGAAFGLGLLAKHTMALLAPCLLLCLLHPRNRAWLKRPHPYAALTLGLAIYAPNLVWQARHDWMTFGHLFILTGKGTDHGFARRFGDFLGSQIGLVTPLLFIGFILAMAWAYRVRNEEQGWRLWMLFCASAPILILFLAMTARSKVQANWAVTGWVAPPILFAAWLEQAGRSSRRFGLVAAALSVVLSTLLIVPEARPALGLRIPRGWDQMNKLYGGRELASGLEEERERMARETGRPVKVGSTTYDATSRMAFYMRDKPEACNLYLGTRRNSYLLWRPEQCPRPGDDMILSDDHAPGEEGRPPFEAVFHRVVPVKHGIPVFRRGTYEEPIHTYYLYRCYGYRKDPAVEPGEPPN